MITVAFILFAVMILAWIVAPNGEPAVKTVKAAKPLLTTTGSIASPAD